MIGFLKGKILLRDDPYILINVHDVGYKVLTSAAVLSEIKNIGQEIQVFTYTHVREDILELYGFLAYADLKLFEQLIGISGIGPKTAIGIFGIGKREQIVNAIIQADVSFFTGVPRLGKKNAQKIIIELKNKIGSEKELDLHAESTKDNEVITALISFGFSSREASIAVQHIGDQGKTVAERVRLAFKYLGKQ